MTGQCVFYHDGMGGDLDCALMCLAERESCRRRLVGGEAERTVFPVGHSVHMSLRHHSETLTDSVAECECGWENLVEWTQAGRADQDEAVEAHWRAIETGAI